MYDSGTERRRSSGVKKAIDLYSVIEDILRHWLSILLLTAGVFICAFVFLSWRVIPAVSRASGFGRARKKEKQTLLI